MDELCAALAAPAKADALEGVATARDESLPVPLLRQVTWSAPMLALFRSVALGRAVPRLVQAAGKAGAIALSSEPKRPSASCACPTDGGPPSYCPLARCRAPFSARRSASAWLKPLPISCSVRVRV